MAITASFTSDWSQFIKGTKEAEDALDQFEKETEAAGGAITKMAGTGAKAGQDMSQVAAAYRQFDGVLSAVGIKIGPAIKAFEDMSAASTKSIGALGGLATAGLVLGTFKAAFDVTRSVIDKFFPDLDNAIARNVSSFMGWGDVAAETAGAVADALALASERAQRPITDMNEAVRINTQWLADRTKKLKEQKDAEKDAAEATARVAVAMQNHKAVLETIEPITRIAAEAELRHGAAARDVALAHQLSAAQIAAVVDKNKQHEEQLKKVNQQLEEQKKKQQEAAAVTAKYWMEVDAIVQKTFGIEKLKAAEQWSRAVEQMGESIDHLSHDQLEELHATMLAAIDAMARSGTLTSEQSGRFAELALKAEALRVALAPVVTVTEDLVKAQWDYVTALDAEAKAQKDAADAAKTHNEATGRGGAGGSGGLPPNAIIGRNGVAMDMFGRPVAGYGAINNLPVVNVSVDGNIIGTEAELARLIGNALTSTYKSGGNRAPV